MLGKKGKELDIFDEETGAYYGVGGFLLEIVKIFFLALVIIIPIRVFLFQPFFVQGASMDPTFKDGEYLIVNELGYKKTDIEIGENKFFSVRPIKNLERGDVIVFRYPKNPQQYFIKRVIALPEEKIIVANNKVTIYNRENPDGILLDEREYVDGEIETSGELSQELEDEYFVMGDNRPFSSDSRSWGPIKREDVIGKVLLRAWPFTQFEVYLQDINYSL